MKFEVKKWWKIFDGKVHYQSLEENVGKAGYLSFCTSEDVVELLELEIEAIQKTVEELKKYPGTPIPLHLVKSQYFSGRSNGFIFIRKMFKISIDYLLESFCFKANIVHLKKEAIEVRRKKLNEDTEKQTSDIKKISETAKSLLKARNDLPQPF